MTEKQKEWRKVREIEDRPKNRKEQYLKRIEVKSIRVTERPQKHWNIKVNIVLILKLIFEGLQHQKGKCINIMGYRLLREHQVSFP